MSRNDLSLLEAIELFIAAQNRMLAPNSIKIYENACQHLTNHFGKAIPIAAISKAKMVEWRNYLLELNKGKLSIYTVRKIMGSVSTLFNWLVEMELLPHSPMRGVKRPAAPDLEPTAILEEELDAILKAAAIYTGTHWHSADFYIKRNTALIMFMASSGCRVMGLCGTLVSDLKIRDESGETLVYEKFRGGVKSRSVFLVTSACVAISEWLEIRPRCNHDYLFSGITGEPITPHAVRQVLDHLSKRAGTRKIKPHDFRHGLALRMLENGSDLATVSQVLGHSGIRITAKFYSRWSKNQLKKRHGEFVDL